MHISPICYNTVKCTSLKGDPKKILHLNDLTLLQQH